MDPCEVPDAGEPRISRLPMACLLLAAAPTIGIGAVKGILFLDTPGELSALLGELCGPNEVDISEDGPDTRTYS